MVTRAKRVAVKQQQWAAGAGYFMYETMQPVMELWFLEWLSAGRVGLVQKKMEPENETIAQVIDINWKLIWAQSTDVEIHNNL